MAVNLPVALTLLRIFLVPLLVALLLTRTPHGTIAGACVFAVAVLTDWLDGYLARRRNQVTKLGILLDPIADKLLTSAAFIALVELGSVPAWMAVIIIGREFAVTWLRTLATGRGVVIAASGLGKSKMVAQVVAISVLILALELPALLPLGRIALWVVVGIAVWSGIDYFVRHGREALWGSPRQ